MSLIINIIIALALLPLALLGFGVSYELLKHYALKIGWQVFKIVSAIVGALDEATNGFSSWLLFYSTIIFCINIVVWAFN